MCLKLVHDLLLPFNSRRYESATCILWKKHNTTRAHKRRCFLFLRTLLEVEARCENERKWGTSSNRIANVNRDGCYSFFQFLFVSSFVSLLFCVACEADVICVKGVSPDMLFAIDRAKQNICDRAEFPPALRSAEEIDRLKNFQNACFAGYILREGGWTWKIRNIDI